MTAQVSSSSTHPPTGIAEPASPELPARYYLRLAELLAALGVDLQALVRQSGVSIERLLQPGATLALGDVQALTCCACRLAGKPELGLLLGARLEPASHEVLGLALQQTRSLDQALRLASRYFSLLSPGFRMRYRLDQGGAEVELIPCLPFEAEALQLHLDTVLAASLGELRFLAGYRLLPRSVELGWARTAYAQRYVDLIGRPPAFAALPLPGIRLSFAASDMLALRPQADTRLLADARQRCEAMVQRTLRRAGLADWTRMMLRHAAHGMPRKQELADLLGLSTRSFTRHLAREGCNFRQLSLQSRLLAAEQTLGHGAESITALAHRLGYSDAANFTRAFRRARGCAPRHWSA